MNGKIRNNFAYRSKLNTCTYTHRKLETEKLRANKKNRLNRKEGRKIYIYMQVHYEFKRRVKEHRERERNLLQISRDGFFAIKLFIASVTQFAEKKENKFAPSQIFPL